MIGQSTASFHARKHKQLHAFLKESIRKGVPISGNVSKELLEKLEAEVRAERKEK
jgi:hypothetical protein